jgi:DEAD/DEAH box helicase domain-containing protein
MIDLRRLLERLPHDSADAITSMARLKSRTLSNHIHAVLDAVGGPESILAEPFLEGAFPWLPFDGGWDKLGAGLFSERTIETLRKVALPPYAHQVDAWRLLCAPDPVSVIVSSGTGSGKTECFLAPILDRLLRLSGGGRDHLTGVRALMLYPLNALISSQEERLLRWLQPFGARLRYCLYNGETPEDVRDEASRSEPWKVLDRKTLRASPPPVLVTNVTMLEYMLIRQKDAPILEASRGKLDFVVLDEAHSYVGAQAAEIALLLRRVALAFGRRPEELRYIATSATIGGEDTDQLKAFLRDLSGAPHDRVHVIHGHRAPLPPAKQDRNVKFTVEELAASEERVSGARLAQSAPLRSVRENLRSGAIIGWTSWRSRCKEILDLKSVDDDAATAFLIEVARARDPGADPAIVRAGADHVLPVRMHLFHRTLSGVWACVNCDCSGRPLPTAGENDWPFGAVFLEPREHCPHCGSIVLEWAFCSQCGEGALKAEEHDGGDRIGTWTDKGLDDDFAQTLELDENYGAEDDEDRDALDVDTIVLRRYLLPRSAGGDPHFRVKPQSGQIMSASAADGLDFSASRDVGSCPHCGATPKRFAPSRGALRSLCTAARF